jgi:hypothetical protein
MSRPRPRDAPVNRTTRPFIENRSAMFRPLSRCSRFFALAADPSL